MCFRSVHIQVLGMEGVVGLPRALLVVGVPCIVASQWKVGDEPSSELMLEFYKEMRGAGMHRLL